MQTIYFDHAATTPPDPRVVDAMMPWFKSEYGNAASIHHMGRMANVAVESCRGKIAKSIGADPAEIIFTSGGTESNNAAIFGVLENSNCREVVSARSEHSAVLYPLKQAQKSGYEIKFVPLDKFGRVRPEDLAEALSNRTAMVSLMHVNNETGCINPISELSAICRERNIAFHSDTVQSIGKIPVNVDELGVDFLSMSAHKFGGPKGVGALYVRAGSPWSAWMHGGLQERGRRGGTLNVPGIIGLSKALEIALDEMEVSRPHIQTLRKRMQKGFSEAFGGTIQFNGDLESGVPNILSVTITDGNNQPLDGEMLLLNLDIEGICCSNGSACTAGTVKPSHVMMALGYDEAMAKSTLRFSLGKTNTADEADKTVSVLKDIVTRHSLAEL